MHRVFSRIDDSLVDPLFELFDRGDFVLSSTRDIENAWAEVQLYFPENGRIEEAKRLLASTLSAAGIDAEVQYAEIPDEDWKLSYRRFFTTERIGSSIAVHPPWEPYPAGVPVVVTLDPGLAFGTGKHETTRTCLEYIERLAPEGGSFMDMGCGSGILSIAASKFGFSPVRGFDCDMEAVEASLRNAAENGVSPEIFKHELGAGGTPLAPADVVVANILGPLLVKFADEIAPVPRRHLVISGILAKEYGEVLAAFESRGFAETDRKTAGEWSTGLLKRLS